MANIIDSYNVNEEKVPMDFTPVSDRFDINSALDSITFKDCVTPQQTKFNQTIDEIRKTPHLDTFSCELYDKIDIIVKEELQSPNKLEKKHTTAFAKRLHIYLSSPQYSTAVKRLFNIEQPTDIHFRVAFAIYECLR